MELLSRPRGSPASHHDRDIYRRKCLKGCRRERDARVLLSAWHSRSSSRLVTSLYTGRCGLAVVVFGLDLEYQKARFERAPSRRPRTSAFSVLALRRLLPSSHVGPTTNEAVALNHLATALLSSCCQLLWPSGPVSRVDSRYGAMLLSCLVPPASSCAVFGRSF